MKLKIHNREYNFELQGTVGYVYLAQKILGYEPDFKNNPTDRLTLYYGVLQTSNPNEQNLPDLMMFIASMTSALMNEIETYFWARWRELEGKDSDAEDDKANAKEGEA